MFVQKQAEIHARTFANEYGFEIDDSVQLSAFLGAQEGHGTRYATLSADHKHLVRGELPLSCRIEPLLRAICDEPRLVALVRALLDDAAIRMHHPPSIRVSRPAMTSSLVPLHKDEDYVTHIGEFVTVWLPLCSIDELLGGLAIVPRSCPSGALHPPRLGAEGIWHDEAVDVPENRRTFIPCEIGDIIVFGPKLLHGSRPNRSNRIRYSIDYRFFPSRQPTSKHYYDLEHRVVIAPTGT